MLRSWNYEVALNEKKNRVIFLLSFLAFSLNNADLYITSLKPLHFTCALLRWKNRRSFTVIKSTHEPVTAYTRILAWVIMMLIIFALILCDFWSIFHTDTQVIVQRCAFDMQCLPNTHTHTTAHIQSTQARVLLNCFVPFPAMRNKLPLTLRLPCCAPRRRLLTCSQGDTSLHKQTNTNMWWQILDLCNPRYWSDQPLIQCYRRYPS